MDGFGGVFMSTLALSSLNNSSTSSSTSTTSPTATAIFEILSTSHACNGIPQHMIHANLYPVRHPRLHFSNEWNKDHPFSTSSLHYPSTLESLRPNNRIILSPRYFGLNSCPPSHMISSSILPNIDSFSVSLPTRRWATSPFPWECSAAMMIGMLLLYDAHSLARPSSPPFCYLMPLHSRTSLVLFAVVGIGSTTLLPLPCMPSPSSYDPCHRLQYWLCSSQHYAAPLS